MFRNRPKQLLDIPNYSSLPPGPIALRLDSLPELLNYDIDFELRGALPLTEHISDLSPDGLYVQPNDAVIADYIARGTKFQLISIVVNFAYFIKNNEGVYEGIPYAVRLLPATARGKVDEQDAKIVSLLDLEALPQNNDVYYGFDPFEGACGLYGPWEFFASTPDVPVFTDTIGFVVGQYLLATDVPLDDIIMIGLHDAPNDLRLRFNRYRSKRYYTPFTDKKPRPIWGTESHIELYLFQALLHRGLRPIPQVRIYRDGLIYPSFHDMYQDENFRSDADLAGTPDFYFLEHKLAVYCDSTSFHRSGKAQAKDRVVSDRMRTLNITPVRISGPTIVHDLNAAVAEVIAHLP